VPGQREAQRQADQFMEKVNAWNNEPQLFKGEDDTVRAVYNKCRELTWPYLKNSTKTQYEENFKRHLLPSFGDSKLSKLSRIELQAYFNSLTPGLSPKTIKLIHGTLRAALNQAIAWEMLSKNPAIGVKLPRKRSVKAPILLPLAEIRRVLQGGIRTDTLNPCANRVCLSAYRRSACTSMERHTSRPHRRRRTRLR
jgi:integrase